MGYVKTIIVAVVNILLILLLLSLFQELAISKWEGSRNEKGGETRREF